MSTGHTRGIDTLSSNMSVKC
uniref:Uncharacterized protein n=1 Tax=Anguilla anguilla TaxID=7936 RepID=A0A0E9QWI9_ANGAN